MQPSDNEPRHRQPTHAIGEDLALLSVEEIDSRIALLRGEIARLEAERRLKDSSKSAAEALFRRSS